jgi:periplasmic divalent cation tolerance protein
MMIYIPCKNKQEARKVGDALLAKRLIACTNMFPIESQYRWKGKMVHDKETVLLAKTTNAKAKAVEAEVLKMHSYKIPCIERIRTTSNSAYLKWVLGEVS